MIPTIEEYNALKNYLVVRPNGTIHFKHGVNKFHTKKFARMTPERKITWPEFQMYYSSICNMIVGNFYVEKDQEMFEEE